MCVSVPKHFKLSDALKQRTLIYAHVDEINTEVLKFAAVFVR